MRIISAYPSLCLDSRTGRSSGALDGKKEGNIACPTSESLRQLTRLSFFPSAFFCVCVSHARKVED